MATPLTADLVTLDHAAYVASPDVIRVHSDGRWPTEGFTLEDDRRLVARHEADHARRRAFTFLLLAPSGREALGCLYLTPLRDYLGRAGAEAQLVEPVSPTSAMVTFWLRQDQQGTGLADDVVAAVDAWLLETWPIDAAVWRVLPAEVGSRRALERAGLQSVTLPHPDDPRPYLWFERPG